MDVLVTGSLGYDYIMNFAGQFADRILPESIHKISLSFLVDNLTKQIGGTAGNIAYTLKLLACEPYILSTAGNDFSQYQLFLKNHNIDQTYIKTVSDVSTGSYFVITDKHDNQIGAFYTGSLRYNDMLSLQSITQPMDFAIIAPNKPEAMVKYVEECIVKHIPYLFDPAFQIGAYPKDALLYGISHATIVIGNDYEIKLLEDKLEIAHEELILATPIVITTLGSKGSIIETRKESIHCNVAKVKKVVDPTGAGDAYRGGFIAGYLRNFDLAVCAQIGAVSAAYTVEQYGTVTHNFTTEQFEKRFKENFGKNIDISYGSR